MRDLQLVEKDETAILKDGEETKTKTYRSVNLCAYGVSNSIYKIGI